MYYDWKDYVSVASRREQAAREIAKLAKKGHTVAPVVIEGRKLAKTFWGKAWCDNLERYSDFANRLPRGRTYVRNGSVVDLQIAPGAVSALVSGSELYRTRVDVAAVPKARWKAVCIDCAGAIDSLIELLQGRFTTAVMGRLCHEQTGLFPSPAEIAFTCSCPDWAWMCKHVAAVLYGIGARLDEQPDLLFTLRKVNQQDLIAKSGTGLTRGAKAPAGAKVLETDDLSAIFGIDIAQGTTPPAAKRKQRLGPAPVKSARGHAERRLSDAGASASASARAGGGAPAPVKGARGHAERRLSDAGASASASVRAGGGAPAPVKKRPPARSR